MTTKAPRDLLRASQIETGTLSPQDDGKATVALTLVRRSPDGKETAICYKFFSRQAVEEVISGLRSATEKLWPAS